MGSQTTIMIIALCLLLTMSAYFSATETAFSSLSRIRIKSMAESGNKKAGLVLRMSDDYDRILSTILIGNNIVNILSTSLATSLFILHFGDIGVTLSTVVMTVAVLIFGEITPKSLAKESPESFALFSAPILNVIAITLTPLNFVFSLWKKAVTKLFKVSENRKMTPDELRVLVDEVTQAGSIDKEEGELLHNAMEFGEQYVDDILTPRIDIAAVPIDCPKSKIARAFRDTGYSRLPVYSGNIDNIVGIIHQKDFFSSKGGIESIMTKPIFIPQSIKISSLLKLLQKNKAHIAVVSDDYGGTLGIVTMEDILEELVGEIWDEHDEVIEAFTKTADNTYRVICSTDLDSFYDYFKISGSSESSTIGGWVMEQLGRIPSENDSFDYENLHITVISTDYRRILEIEVKVNDKAE